jgi:hypothetical protein
MTHTSPNCAQLSLRCFFLFLVPRHQGWTPRHTPDGHGPASPTHRIGTIGPKKQAGVPEEATMFLLWPVSGTQSGPLATFRDCQGGPVEIRPADRGVVGHLMPWKVLTASGSPAWGSKSPPCFKGSTLGCSLCCRLALEGLRPRHSHLDSSFPACSGISASGDHMLSWKSPESGRRKRQQWV